MFKSPGPDGFPVFFFYQKYWSIIGPNVIAGVLEFLNTKSLPGPNNFTYVVLIPKIKKPLNMADFRPISLSNVITSLGPKLLRTDLKPYSHL